MNVLRNNYFYLFILIVTLGLFNSSCKLFCTEEKTEPTIECPEGYHPCDSDADTLTCCPDEIPATMTQTHAPWPGLADTPWPMYMHDPQHTGRSQYDGPELGEVEWAITETAEVFSNPVIDPNGNILVSSRLDLGGHQKLQSITPDGAVNWTVEFGGHIDSSPLISADNHIYVCHSEQDGSRTLYLVKLDLNGNIIWKYDLGRINRWNKGTFSPNISIDGETIYVCGIDSSLIAINSNGNIDWKFLKKQEVITGEVSISPDGESIYVITNRNNLISINTFGEEIWSVKLDTTQTWVYTMGDTTYTAIISPPTIDTDGNIYLSSHTKMISISPHGFIRWKNEQGTFISPTLHSGVSIGPDGMIYTTSGSSVFAFYYNGYLAWNRQTGLLFAKLVIDKSGNLYLGTTRGIGYITDDHTNFVSFDNMGLIRYAILLNINHVPDIDSTPCISQTNIIYVGSDAGSPNGFFKLK